MEQLGSHCSDFHEIWYLSIFRKSVEKIQVSLKSDKTNGYFTRKALHIYDYISHMYSKNENVSDNICRGNQNTHFVFSSVLFFGNRAVYEIMWKNIAGPERPQLKIQQCARTLHAGYQRLHKTHRICNTYCFYTAMFVAYIAHCPSSPPLHVPVFLL